MGGFLVIALAIPNAYDGEGLAFGIGYAVVVVLHAGMYAKGTSVSEVRGDPPHRPVQPHGGGAGAHRGAPGGRRRTSCGPLAALLLWVTPWFTSTEGFVIAAEHFSSATAS